MKKQIRAAVVGSINRDLICKTDRIPQAGENIVGKSYSYAFGGKGANQATALVKLGVKTKLIGKVADDANGRALVANLRQKGVDVTDVFTDGSQTGLGIIWLDAEGKNRILVFEGANTELTGSEATGALSDLPDILLVQFETTVEAVTESVKLATANNIISVVDCGPAKDFPLEKMQGMTIITPNESETEMLTGVLPDSRENIQKASEILIQRSNAKYAVLKLGSHGCSVWDGKELTLLPAIETETVDTTAAGDCFTAAMALEFALNGDIIEACKIGNAAGSFAVSRLGADSSMPTAEDLAKIYNN